MNIKTQLTRKLENIYVLPGSLSAKEQIFHIVDPFFNKLYTSGMVDDYTYDISCPQENEYDVESVKKNGPATYWVNYDIKLPESTQMVGDSVTVRITKRIVIGTPSELLGTPPGVLPGQQKTISSNSEFEFPDYTGVKFNK